MLFLQARLFLRMRAHEPERGHGREALGPSPAGLFGYSHLLCGYSGGRAEYLRVPYADVGPLKVPDGLGDEQVLFLSDIFPTGCMAAEFCNIQPEDTLADIEFRRR
jgi:threonine dehydrogenase-like Zn-dependent dehydrogenase